MKNRFWHILLIALGLGLGFTVCALVSSVFMVSISFSKMASATEISTVVVTPTQTLTIPASVSMPTKFAAYVVAPMANAVPAASSANRRTLALAEVASIPTAPVPKSPKEVPRIKPQELKALMDREADIEILDTQSAQGFAAMHIPKVFNLPWADEIKSAMGLPKDKCLVLYCGSDNERDSSDVAFQLITRFGYTQVMVLEGGILQWKKLDYPIETSFWD